MNIWSNVQKLVTHCEIGNQTCKRECYLLVSKQKIGISLLESFMNLSFFWMGYYPSFLAYQMEVSKAHSSTAWLLFAWVTDEILEHTQSYLIGINILGYPQVTTLGMNVFQKKLTH